MTFRRYMILVCVMVSGAFGDTFLSAGMKQVGPVSLRHLLDLVIALKNPWVLNGVALLIVFFASYLTALSWADLTFVLPATSFGYVIIALLSQFWLHEDLSLSRWAGILLITLGVGFVTQGPSYTHHAETQHTGVVDSSLEIAVPSSLNRIGTGQEKEHSV